jgi:putative ABC transport system permease protein
MLQDYKLGFRMLLKYPGLAIAGGLALAVAIGVGAGWYDLAGKLVSPTIPLPDGDRIVLIQTHNTLTNEPELRVARDFLEWRRELRSIEDLGAFRSDGRNLVVGNAPLALIQSAELTAAAFRAARVPPLFGRGLLDSDENPGAPSVVVLGYDVWQRFFAGRHDVIGSVVKLGSTPATVIGVMPEDFAYPVNHRAWTPLQVRASYDALEGGAIGVIGRLRPGVALEQANAELRVLGERAAATLPETHEHLRPRMTPLAGGDIPDLAQLAVTYLPALLVLLLACTTVGTLIYARTAIREGEIALRSALGASRARILGQLFVEALVLASVAGVVGLLAADRTLRWGMQAAYGDDGGVPFWMTPGLEIGTILYAGVLAVACAAMLSLLPALRATRVRVQPHLVNLGAGGATLRFGRVWTIAMITQVGLTAIAIPVAIEGASEAIRNVRIRAEFPNREYLASRLELDRPSRDETSSAFEARRSQTYARLERRLAQEPGVVAVTFADRAPGSTPTGSRKAEIDIASGAQQTIDIGFSSSSVGPAFFEAFDRPIVSGRAFHGGDFSSAARTVIVNEAFVRRLAQRGGSGSPIGARLRYSDRFGAATQDAAAGEASVATLFEIVGVARDIGLDPDDEGNESPYVFHPATAATVSPFVMSVRARGNPATLAARLPTIAADVDAGLAVQKAQPLSEWIRERDLDVITSVGTLAGVTFLVLFLSAMGIFSLMSVSVSRRTREIGVRTALGASPRHVLAGIMSHAMMLMGSGITAGGAIVLLSVALGAGPTGRPGDDVVKFIIWLAATSAVMLAACVLACIEPARRALRINAIDALRET